MLKTIRLYGKLGYRFGRVHRLDVASPAEAVRALCSQVRGFKQFLLDSKAKYNIVYGVFVGKRNISESELRDPSGSHDIRIAPFAVGAKSEWVQVIVGIVLVVVGYVLTAFGYGAIGVPIANLGWGLIAGGVAQLLTPNPKVNGPNDKVDNKASTQFSGPVNTQAQGNIVGVMYGGPVIVGSAVISAGIEAKDNAYVPRGDRSDPDVYGGGSKYWNSEARGEP